MTLRTRTLLVLVATLAALLVVVYFGASRALLSAFSRLEAESVQRSVDSVLNVLADEKGKLDAAALRWASSPAVDRTPGYAGRAAATIPEGGVEDFAASIDSGEAVTMLAVRERRTGTAEDLTSALAGAIAANPSLTRHAHTGSSTRGVVELSGQPVLVASRPRITATAPGVIVGVVVVGRFLDEQAIDRLGTAAQVSLAAARAGGRELPEDFAAAIGQRPRSGRTVVRPLAGGWIAGYRVIDDVGGRPALVLRVDAPRSVFLQGRSSLTFMILVLLLVAVAFAVASFAVLDRTVLRRLTWLTGNVATIGASRSLSARLPVTGNDELAQLALRINEMLDAREKAQDERGESEARYRAVFEQGGDGIVLFDPTSGHLLDANPAAQRMLGYGLGELLELRVHDVMLDASTGLDDHIAQVRRERRVFAGDAMFRRRDGSALTGDVTSSLVAMRGRDVICSVVRDTGARRRLEARLRQSQKLEAVGRLASGVAHDFNNLLQAVVSSVGLLRASGANDVVRSRVTETLEAQVASGGTLTRQLAILGRHDAFAAGALDLNELVKETSGFLRRVMRENVRFEVGLAPGPLPTVGDRGRLEQGLINLVTNATDAMPSGGLATIRTGRSEGRVWFEVCDQGPGIPPSVRDRMFEPFFTTKAGTYHSGLGLTVVQHVVEEHGGSIAVASRSGEGTSFRVMLPEESPSAVTVETPPTEVVAVGRHGGRILLVEDGEEIRRGLSEMLSLLGYEVVAVASGEDALAGTVGATADLLLTDYMLPGMTGAELATELLSQRPDLRVIVISGYAAESAVPTDDERVRFLAKPFGMDTLARTVEAALATPRHPTS